MSQKTYLRTITRSAISCLLMATLSTSLAAQSNSMASAGTPPSNLVTTSMGTSSSPGSTSSSGSTPAGPRTRTIVSLNWYGGTPVVLPRRYRSSPISYLPRARRTVSAPILTPFVSVQTGSPGLSTAMPNWKVATSVLQTTVPATGHTTYSPPPVVSTYDVVLPRRNYSYGISFVRTH